MPTISIQDLQLYYELLGEGPPLVLLNGALDTIESDWEGHLHTLAQHFRVLAYDHRGHGRTDNPSGVFTGYGQLGSDLEALLDAFGLAQAHFCGFSDGAITLMTWAPGHLDRIHSLVLAGGQYTNDERTRALLGKMTPERIVERQPVWAERLSRLHDGGRYPGYWQELLRQMTPMWRVEPDFSSAHLGTISAPTLLVAGERDGFGHLDQQLVMRRALPRAELCIAPAAGHFVMNDQPELFRLVTLNFLTRPDHNAAGRTSI